MGKRTNQTNRLHAAAGMSSPNSEPVMCRVRNAGRDSGWKRESVRQELSTKWYWMQKIDSGPQIPFSVPGLRAMCLAYMHVYSHEGCGS